MITRKKRKLKVEEEKNEMLEIEENEIEWKKITFNRTQCFEIYRILKVWIFSFESWFGWNIISIIIMKSKFRIYI